jgi:hypothetical protein
MLLDPPVNKRVVVDVNLQPLDARVATRDVFLDVDGFKTQPKEKHPNRKGWLPGEPGKRKLTLISH